jgi:hypothetical protein
MNTLTGRAAGISDLKFQISEGQSGAAAPHSKNGVNIFVFVWIRKEASGATAGDRGDRKGEGGKNRKKRGYNRRAREVAMVMDDAAERKTYDAECD